MLSVNKFVVNGTVIKNPDSKYIKKVLNNIFEEGEYSIRNYWKTKIITDTYPQINKLDFWPHVNIINNRKEHTTNEFEVLISSTFFIYHHGIKYTNIFTTLLDKLKNKTTLSKEDKKSLHKFFRGMVAEVVKNKNILGFTSRAPLARRNANVYMIDKNYALKLLGENDPDVSIFVKPEDITKCNPLKGSKTYYGYPIFQMGKYFQILPNVGTHIPAGKNRLAKYSGNEYDYYCRRYLPLFSRVPQESFDDIAYDFARFNSMHNNTGACAWFDFNNPNNIILKNKKLYLVDEILYVKDENNSLAEFLFSMLSATTPYTFIARGFGNSLPYAQNIFKKIILAGAKAQLPITDGKEYKLARLETVLKNMEIDLPEKELNKELEHLYSIGDEETRLKAIEQYVDKLFKNNS